MGAKSNTFLTTQFLVVGIVSSWITFILINSSINLSISVRYVFFDVLLALNY